MPALITPAWELTRSLGITGDVFSFNRVLTFEPPILIARNVRLWETNHIGQLSYVNDNCQLNNVTMGRYCSVAENVFIGLNQHPTDRISTHPFTYNGALPSGVVENDDYFFEHFAPWKRIVDRKSFFPSDGVPRTTIGNDVWIGHQAVIMSGLTVGDGAIIGANAVVTHDVEPYTIVGGVPARPIRKRFDDSIIDKLMVVKWWEYDISPLREKVAYSDVGLFIQTLEQMIAEGQVNRLAALQRTLKNTE